jgi:hypothetical protein
MFSVFLDCQRPPRAFKILSIIMSKVGGKNTVSKASSRLSKSRDSVVTVSRPSLPRKVAKTSPYIFDGEGEGEQKEKSKPSPPVSGMVLAICLYAACATFVCI